MRFPSARPRCRPESAHRHPSTHIDRQTGGGHRDSGWDPLNCSGEDTGDRATMLHSREPRADRRRLRDEEIALQDEDSVTHPPEAIGGVDAEMRSAPARCAIVCA